MVEATQDPLGFLTAEGRFAIVIGPELRMMSPHSIGGLLLGSALRLQRARPDAVLIDYRNLGSNSLAAFKAVVILTHGAPGLSSWGGSTVQNFQTGEVTKLPGYREVGGAELAGIIKGAGFRGHRILLDSCNGGTDTKPDQHEGSTAQDIAKSTGAEVLAPRADDAWKNYAITKEPIFELLAAERPRLVTSEDIGAFIVSADKSRFVREVGADWRGRDLATEFAGNYLANTTTGGVLTTGSLASDIDPKAEPLVTRVPHGHWVVYAPAGGYRVYANK